MKPFGRGGPMILPWLSSIGMCRVGLILMVSMFYGGPLMRESRNGPGHSVHMRV